MPATCSVSNPRCQQQPTMPTITRDASTNTTSNQTAPTTTITLHTSNQPQCQHPAMPATRNANNPQCQQPATPATHNANNPRCQQPAMAITRNASNNLRCQQPAMPAT